MLCAGTDGGYLTLMGLYNPVSALKGKMKIRGAFIVTNFVDRNELGGYSPKLQFKVSLLRISRGSRSSYVLTLFIQILVQAVNQLLIHKV